MNKFRNVCITIGLTNVCVIDRFTEALPYFNQAWLHNMSAMSGKTALAGINTLLISYFRRKCLEVGRYPLI